MSLFYRANAISLVALIGCANAPPPAPKQPVEEEAFVLDSKDPNATAAPDAKSKKKKGKGSASADDSSASTSASGDVGSSLGSSPDHFGRYRLGASQAAFGGQSVVSEHGRTSIALGPSSYHGVSLSALSVQFKNRVLDRLHFAANGSSECKRILSALQSDYGTGVSSDQQYTTTTPRYEWSSATGMLSFEIGLGFCNGSLEVVRQGATDDPW